MSSYILRILLMAFILLFNIENVLAQSSRPNLHTTVTHSPTPSATTIGGSVNAASKKANAQEHIMTNEYGRFEKNVNGFKDRIERQLDESKDLGIGIDVKHRIKDWTKEDLVNLATSVNGAPMFYFLIEASSAAIVKTYDGKYTEDAICAQNALNALKPDCCKNWQAFNNMIYDVRGETNDKFNKIFKDFPEVRKRLIAPHERHAKGYSAVMDIKHLSIDIASTDERVTNIDPTAALAAAGAKLHTKTGFDEMANAALAKLKAEKSSALAA